MTATGLRPVVPVPVLYMDVGSDVVIRQQAQELFDYQTDDINVTPSCHCGYVANENAFLYMHAANTSWGERFLVAMEKLYPLTNRHLMPAAARGLLRHQRHNKQSGQFYRRDG